MPYNIIGIEPNLPVQPAHILQIIDSLQFASASIANARAGRTNYGAAYFTSSAHVEMHDYSGNDALMVYAGATETLNVRANGDVVVTGSLKVDGSIQGTLSGTAATASYVLNAVSASYAATAATASYILNAVNAQTASYVLNAVTASYVQTAQTASYVPLKAGPGITINGFDITASVRTVNGVSPVNGNILISIAGVSTGTLAARPSSAADGTIYVVSGDPVSANNGLTYIYSTSAAAWQQIAPLDIAAADARYIKLDGVNTPLQGNLDLGGYDLTNGGTFYGNLEGTAATASYVVTALTASYVVSALTASYVENAQTASYYDFTGTGILSGSLFPYSGSAEITGSLGLTGSFLQGINHSIDTAATQPFVHGRQNTVAFAAAYGHAEGRETEVNADYGHAEGYRARANAGYSHAEGDTTNAGGMYSHTEGYQTSTGINANHAHAEGYVAQANAQYSHAEGFQTRINSVADASHTEGINTQATGSYSHAEGNFTRTVGAHSHAEGSGSVAFGIGSHAEGLWTIASGSAQHVSGRYNIKGNTTSIFVIGNGTGVDDADRSDIVRVNQTDVQITGSVKATAGFTGSFTGSFTGDGSGLTGIAQSIATSGTSLYSTNPATSGFGTTEGLFLGTGSGDNASNANNSNFIGAYAGRGATNANFSVFVGQEAGSGSTAANTSNFIGYKAGQLATNAYQSTFIGWETGQVATFSDHAVFIGTAAGAAASNAGYSVFVGDNAGVSAAGADYSVFLGALAGYASTNANRSFFAGANAGRGQTAASYSIALGNSAGYNPGGQLLGSNNIILGTNVTLPNGARNSINLGGLIFGTGTYAASSGAPSAAAANGNVGINNSSPQYSLDVSGSFRVLDGVAILEQVSQSLNFVDDAAAATGGVPLGGLYRSGNIICIRIV